MQHTLHIERGVPRRVLQNNATYVALFGAHLREEDYVADVGRVGQQHNQPVNADAATAGRRQAVFERADVVGVVVHGFFITGILGFGLLHEAVGLIFRVVQLGEGVGDFTANNKQFETLGDLGVAVTGARQRANFGRVVDDEGR